MLTRCRQGPPASCKAGCNAGDNIKLRLLAIPACLPALGALKVEGIGVPGWGRCGARSHCITPATCCSRCEATDAKYQYKSQETLGESTCTARGAPALHSGQGMGIAGSDSTRLQAGHAVTRCPMFWCRCHRAGGSSDLPGRQSGAGRRPAGTGTPGRQGACSRRPDHAAQRR